MKNTEIKSVIGYHSLGADSTPNASIIVLNLHCSIRTKYVVVANFIYLSMFVKYPDGLFANIEVLGLYCLKLLSWQVLYFDQTV